MNKIIPLFKQWFEEQTGKTITVNFRPMGSRSIILSIITGEIKPTIISPASGIWLPYLNSLWKNNPVNTKDIVHLSNPNLTTSCIYSPIVIGTWDWYNASVGGISNFQDIHDLTLDQFRWAHTDPQLSNSGFMTIIMMVAAYLSKNTTELVTTDLQNPNLQQWMRQIESDIAFYGKSTGFLAKKSVQLGLNAFMVYENIIIDFNRKASGDSSKAIAVYPSDGTLLSDHPFAILDTEWVSDDDRYAATRFLEFIQMDEIVAKAFQYGFRPLNETILQNPAYNSTFNTYFTENYGVQHDISVPIYGTTIDSLVLDQITDLWIVTRNLGL